MSHRQPLRSARYDVVVVGARCAGAATALLLARSGARVLLLDAARAGTDTGSTHALMRGGVLQLQRWRVLEQVAAAGTPAVRHTAFHFDQDRLDVSIRPAHGVDVLYAPRRFLLDRLLADAAAAAGAEVRFGTRVLDLAREGGRVTGVVLAGRRGRTVVRADLVVGADGVRSLVAQEVAAPVLRTGRSATTVVYGYYQDLPTDGYEWFYRPGGTAGFIPTNDGLTAVFAAAPPALVRQVRVQGLPAAFPELLARATPPGAARVREARRTGHLRTHPGTRGFLRQAHGPGWALVGDAGYFKDPVTAHGITDALRDAELLAGAVATNRLSDYQRTRDVLSERLFSVTDEVASLSWDLPRLRVLLRELSSAMAVEVEHLVHRGHGDANRDVLVAAG